MTGANRHLAVAVRKWIITVCAALLASACFGTVNPLAPGLRGSVGLPNHGVLTDGMELPLSGVGFERYRTASPNYWGVPRLVTAVQSAAAAVAAAHCGGPPLLVGDLSAPTGGKIPHHASHRTGRDVDLLFYFTDVYGQPVKSPGFVSVGSDTIAAVPWSHEFVRLDVAREWQLVRALLTDARIEVLWLFISRDIEAMLLQQALALGEPAWIVWRAQQVMHQPRDSATHDDHIHLRIACTAEERPLGCEGGGPYWPWFDSLGAQEDLDAILLEAVALDEPIDSNSGWLTSNGTQTSTH